MDIKEVMVLVKGQDKTAEISNFSYDLENRKVRIAYRRGFTTYTYKQSNVVIIEKPKVIGLEGHAAYVDGMPVYEPQLILDFGQRIRIIKRNGESLTVRPQSLSLVKNGAANQSSQQILTYLKEISQYTSDDPEEEAFLSKEMEQLTFVHPESVLSCYLNQQAIKSRNFDTDHTIFPF